MGMDLNPVNLHLEISGFPGKNCPQKFKYLNHLIIMWEVKFVKMKCRPIFQGILVKMWESQKPGMDLIKCGKKMGKSKVLNTRCLHLNTSSIVKISRLALYRLFIYPFYIKNLFKGSTNLCKIDEVFKEKWSLFKGLVCGKKMGKLTKSSLINYNYWYITISNYWYTTINTL